MTLPDLTGHTVESASYVGGLYIDTQEGWQITIESDFSLREGATTSTKSDGDLDAMVARLVELTGERINQFAMSDSGTLTFAVGPVTVTAAPSPKYEAWNISGPDKQLVVCTPGGELAIWS